MGTRARGFVTAVLALIGLLAVPQGEASATGARCVGVTHVLYAVRADTGHLSEIDYCDGRGFLRQREVSTEDWRKYRQVVPAGLGVVYAVTTSGTLLWRRQGWHGGPLGAPRVVGSSVDWSQRALVAAGNGFLVGVSDQIEVYRHVHWFHGGPVVVRESTDPLRLNHHPLSAVHGGSFGEAINLGVHLRVWSGVSGARLFSSGALPADVSSVTGGEPALFGLGKGGSVVRLSQAIRYVRDSSGNLITCPVREPADWLVTATVPGSYESLFAAPTDFPSKPPQLAPKPSQSIACGFDPFPYEWQ